MEWPDTNEKVQVQRYKRPTFNPDSFFEEENDEIKGWNHIEHEYDRVLRGYPLREYLCIDSLIPYLNPSSQILDKVILERSK